MVGDDSSTLLLAETGSYLGVDDIQEYIAFVTSRYFSNFDLSSRDTFLQFISSRWGTCQIIATFKTIGELDEAFTGNSGCTENLIGAKALYSPGLPFGLFGNGFLINRIDLFFPGRFLERVFGTSLNTDQVATYICDVMENSCSSTFIANNLTTPESCLAKYNVLNATQGIGYIDGLSHTSYSICRNE